MVCFMDNVLILGSNKDEHNIRLMAVLQRLEKAGVTLNFQKCQFLQESIKILGHVIDKNGIHANPEKTTPISKMKPPQSVSDLRRFMGLVNQLGKFSSRIAEISQPVRELLHSNRAWICGPDQEKSFSEIKQELTKPAVLALYNPQTETKMSADASSFGLGAVLLQLNDQSWKPVTYASRSLMGMER